VREIRYDVFASPLGPLHVGASDAGLAAVGWGGDEIAFRAAATKRFGVEPLRDPKAVAQPVEELSAYFRGELRTFQTPFDLSSGTEFQRRCWEALLRIPYGATRTYKWVAKEVGATDGFRAVGMANHRNPLMIVVPCHRVVAHDGTLGGYAAGLDVKRRLLALESGVRPLAAAPES